jgi:hypothetical protein
MFGDFESEVIFEVAEALRVPVLLLTVLAAGVSRPTGAGRG